MEPDCLCGGVSSKIIWEAVSELTPLNSPGDEHKRVKVHVHVCQTHVPGDEKRLSFTQTPPKWTRKPARRAHPRTKPGCLACTRRLIKSMSLICSRARDFAAWLSVQFAFLSSWPN